MEGSKKDDLENGMGNAIRASSLRSINLALLLRNFARIRSGRSFCSVLFRMRRAYLDQNGNGKRFHLSLNTRNQLYRVFHDKRL